MMEISPAHASATSLVCVLLSVGGFAFGCATATDEQPPRTKADRPSLEPNGGEAGSVSLGSAGSTGFGGSGSGGASVDGTGGGSLVPLPSCDCPSTTAPPVGDCTTTAQIGFESSPPQVTTLFKAVQELKTCSSRSYCGSSSLMGCLSAEGPSVWSDIIIPVSGNPDLVGKTVKAHIYFDGPLLAPGWVDLWANPRNGASTIAHADFSSEGSNKWIALIGTVTERENAEDTINGFTVALRFNDGANWKGKIYIDDISWE